MMNKKKVCIFISILIIIFVAIVICVNFIAKKNLLNNIYENQIKRKEISSIEYMNYEKEPFMSVLKENKITTNKNSEAFKFVSSINKYSIHILKSNDTTNEILYITFKDKSNLILYIDDSSIGIDSGKVWIKNVNIDKIIKDMKTKTIIKKIN